MTTSITLQANPTEALQPTSIRITATGFAPGQAVRIASALIDDVGVEWSAHGLFVADAAGKIDLHDAPSEDGTFTGVDPAGLFWSMRPAPVGDRRFLLNATDRLHKLGQPACDPLKPLAIELSATIGEQTVASTTVTLHRLLPDIEALPVRDGRLRGMAFRWRDRSRKRGAIMSLTGSSGGVELNYAPILASLGYDVLSLAYFAYEDLPTGIAAIPLEYFEAGFQWMQREFGAERIAVQGASRGGEATLTLASYLPEYVQGALAIVPMYTTSVGWDFSKNVAGPSWTFRGAEIPYAAADGATSIEDMRRIAEQSPNGYATAPEYKAAFNRPYAREHCALPVERARGPILLISGADDQMWPSTWGSDLVIDRLRTQGFEHPFRHLALRETGHLTPLPNTATTFCEALLHARINILLACGGTPAGTARSSRESWDAMREHYRLVFGH